MFDILRKMLRMEAEKIDRVYKFPLPYKIQAIYLHYGLRQLKAEGIFSRLPVALQDKWLKALNNWRDLRVTKEDLDQIDTSTWTRIANKLNLEWENR